MKFLSNTRWSPLLISFITTGLFAQTESQISTSKWKVDDFRNEAHLAKINVDEGTWMNVSISPDGKTIVFEPLVLGRWKNQ